MPAYPPLHIAFLDSWHADRARGSGSTAAIRGLRIGLEAHGHRVVHLRPWSHRTPSLLGRLLYNLRLRGRLRGHPFDLIVAFDLDGCLLPAGRGRVVCLKGVAADERRFERGVTRLRVGVHGALEARNARRARLVVVPSRYSRRVAVEAYGLDPARVRVVPEGLRLDEWRKVALTAAPRAAASRPPLTVLSVARQYPRKNTAVLLEATALLLRRAGVPSPRVRVVGGGPELPRLRRMADRLGLGPHVRLLGELRSDGAVRAEYAAADVFCLPTLQEGFGLAFLEAMAAGLPVVGSTEGAVPEVVPDGVAGLLVDPRRPVEVADALELLLRDPALRSRMGAAGRRHAERYDWPPVAGRFLATVWGALVEDPAARQRRRTDTSPRSRGLEPERRP